MENFYNELTRYLDSRDKNFGVSPAYYVDRLSNEIKHGDTVSKFVLRNKIDGSYTLISEKEAFIWLIIRKSPSLKELIRKYYMTFTALEWELIDSIFEKWYAKGILIKKNRDIFKLIEKRIEEKKYGFVQRYTVYFFTKIKNLLHVRKSIPYFAQLINFIYRVSVKYFSNKILLLISLCIAAFGTSLLLSELINGNITAVLENADSNEYFFLAFLFLSIFSLFLHEVAHGFALNKSGLEVKTAGARLLFGIPFFFVDTTDAWSRSRYNRIMVSSAGIIANFLLAGFSFLLYLSIESSFWQVILIYFAFVNFTNILINFIPFIELDGYYILIDVFQTPNLSQGSKEAFRRVFKKKRYDNDFKLSAFGAMYFVTLGIFLMLTVLMFNDLVAGFANIISR